MGAPGYRGTTHLLLLPSEGGGYYPQTLSNTTLVMKGKTGGMRAACGAALDPGTGATWSLTLTTCPACHASDAYRAAQVAAVLRRKS